MIPATIRSSGYKDAEEQKTNRSVTCYYTERSSGYLMMKCLSKMLKNRKLIPVIPATIRSSGYLMMKCRTKMLKNRKLIEVLPATIQ